GYRSRSSLWQASWVSGLEDGISPPRSLRLTVWFSAAYHLLTVGVQGVIDGRFGCNDCVIVSISKMAETFGDRLQSCRFGLMPEGVIRVSSIDDLCQECDCWIFLEPMLLDQGIKRT